MTAHRPIRRWIHVPLGLLGLTGLAWAAPAAAAGLAASTVPAPQTLTWSTVSAPTAPPPLAYASAVYDSDNKTVVLFGGVTSTGTMSNDTWVWNGSSWTDYPGSEVQAPPPREMASMAFDPLLHQLILFGGEGADGQPLGDTWAWNGVSWIQQSDQTSSQSPTSRLGAALAYDGAGHLVLFGGTGPTSSPPASSTTSTTTDGTAVTDGSGSTGSDSGSTQSTSTSGPMTALGDTWLWTSAGWSPTTVSGPPARSGAAMGFDSVGNKAVLFGGESTPAGSASPSLLDDTWTWDGTSWAPLSPAISPPDRVGAAMASNGLTSGGGLVLFGGSGTTGALQDTYLWNGSSWADAKAVDPPSPRAGAATAFDDSSGQLVLFGGIGPGGVILGDTVILSAKAPVPLQSTSVPTPSSRARPTVSTTMPAPVKQPTNVKPQTTAPTSTVPLPVGNPVVSPKTTPPLSATTHVLHRGALVTLTGSGFSPGAIITITFHSTAVVVGVTHADRRGDFSATVAVPVSAAGGTHHFEAVGRNRAGQLTELITAVNVVGVPRIGSASSSLQAVVLVTVAFAIPLSTWFFLMGAGWWRRRPTRAV